MSMASRRDGRPSVDLAVEIRRRAARAGGSLAVVAAFAAACAIGFAASTGLAGLVP